MKTLSEIRRFFAQNQTPIYYLNTTLFNLIGAEEWIGGLQFINTVDSFTGQHPGVFVPPGATAHQVKGLADANNYLLKHPAVAQFIAPDGKALFLIFDEQAESLAQGLGLQVCLPPVALRNDLDSKVTTTEIANRAGVASVPNVLAKVESYAGLRRAALALGDDFVVQLPHGDSGNTTFFISSEDDFERHAENIAAHPVVKVMRRIRCRQLTIEGCATRHGTLVGPLQTELVGFAELTPFGGGWCGNEVFADGESAMLTANLRQQAQQAVLAMGEQLLQAGYRGCFGLDLLLDQDTGALYLGEMNPRITGASPMTSQTMLEAGSVPLLLFHLLEWFGADYELDVAAYNQQWLHAERLANWSQMILEHTGDEPVVVSSAPQTGLWRMQSDGTMQFARNAFQPSAIAAENEALFLRTVNPGQPQNKGWGLGRIVLRGRLLTDGYQLNGRAQAWIRGFKAHFQMQPAGRQIRVAA
jgi:hypothetical protein